ncbi:MAG: hypothetical protein ACRDDZ_03495 [Marinifilaceae bacterium]
MFDQEALNKAIETKDQASIENILEQLKSEGELSDIPSLFELLKKYVGTDFEYTLVALLSDVRIKGFKDELIKAIENKENIAIKEQLVRLCWEGTFDFSDHIGMFTNILFHDEFPIALEAATVIEESLPNATEEVRNKLLNNLQMSHTDPARTFLINDLIAKINNVQDEE